MVGFEISTGQPGKGLFDTAGTFTWFAWYRLDRDM